MVPDSKKCRSFLSAPFVLVYALVFFGLMTNVVFATPPTSPYAPGETLNPSCAPGATNCTVVTPAVGTSTVGGLVTFWNNTSTVSANSALSWDNTNLRLGIGAQFPSSTLYILGSAGQAADLLQVASSSGLVFFQISNGGVVSSTNFSFVNASGTNLSLSGYGLFGTLLAQNAVGLGSLSTSTSLVFIQGTQVASTSLNIRGMTNQTANLLTISSSTGTNYFTVDQIGNVSSTQNLTIGGSLQANALQFTFLNASGTNLGLANVSSSNASSTNLTLNGSITIASTSAIFGTNYNGNVMIATTTAQAHSLLNIATSTPIFTVLDSGQVSVGSTTPTLAFTVTNSSSQSMVGIDISSPSPNRYLDVMSSSGLSYFTIDSTGLASSTNWIAVNASTTRLDVSGFMSLNSASSSGNVTIGGSFQSNAGENTLGNASTTNLDVATRFNFTAASSTGNLTVTGANTQITNQLTFANASSTNLDVATRFNFASASATNNVTLGGSNTQILNQLTFANASGTNLFGSGYLTIQGNALFTGSNLAVASAATSTSLVFLQGTQAASTTLLIRGATNQTADILDIGSSTGQLFFQIGPTGNVSTTNVSTTVLDVTNRLTFGSASTTGNLTIGGSLQSNAGQTTLASTTIGTSTFAANNALLTIATTTNILTVLSNGQVFLQNGRLAINTSTFFSATSTLVVCALTNCTLPATASSSNAVAFFASTLGNSSSASITARGTIASGMTDIGEFIKVVGNENDYEAGDVLSVSAASPGSFEKSSVPYDLRLAGVITETAGLVAGGGEDYHGNKIIALAGRLPIKVTGENGPIQSGDYLTSSGSKPGYAMKATKSGKVVAVAMAPFNGTSVSDLGKVLAFINLGWHSADEVAATSLFGQNIISQPIQGGSIMGQALNNSNFDPSYVYTVNNLKVQNLEVGSPEAPAGITIYDTVTKSPYCIAVENGALKANPGRCGNISPGNAAASNQTTTTQSIDISAPTTNGSTTRDVTIATTTTDTTSTDTVPTSTQPSTTPAATSSAATSTAQ